MERERNTETKRKTTTTVKLDEEDLRVLAGAPKGAKVFVHVPGGGDYSSTDLDVGCGEQVIVVQWTEEEKS